MARGYGWGNISVSTPPWLENRTSDRYRELLDESENRSSHEPEDRIDDVLSRARQRLALRDSLALGFGSLVAVLLSLLGATVRHLRHRRNASAKLTNPQ